MKKIVLKVFLIISIVSFFACNEDDDLALNKSYFEIDVNGKKYEGNVESWSGNEMETCDDKTSLIVNIGEVEASDFFFDLNMLHYANLEDFIAAPEGNYEVKETFGLDNLCNFDARGRFEDKTQNNYITNIVNGTNTVTGIQKLEEGNLFVSYAIQGNFNCVFVNKSEEEITVTGKYNLLTVVYLQ